MNLQDASTLNAILLLLQFIILPVLGWIGITLWGLKEQISAATRATAVLDKHVSGRLGTLEDKVADHEQRIRYLERPQ